MTWADFYLLCFVVGFALSLISVLGGVFHLPHVHHGHLHFGHGPAHGSAGRVSLFNFSSMTAFLVWFGGIGYLLTKFSALWLGFAFLIATASGVVAASLVFVFFAKVLLADDTELDPADYDMIGVLGRVSARIRESGTGEISFTQAGARRSAAARTEDGTAIEKDAEVIVTRYDKGIAYVRRWEDLTGSKENI
jgi:membrane protein implicated in regulation of membrane protease activity